MNSVFKASTQFGDLGSLLQEVIKISEGRKVFILTDTSVGEIWIDDFISTNENLGEVEILEVEPGEGSKSIEVCAQLWDHLLECNADRNALLINIGGGVITDLGGFVAATYKRGIPFIQIPTTLLGMVDAANGGKTGINHYHTKNSIGSFQLPEAVLIFSGFLETLEELELKSGFAEMLKHGLIKDAQHWKELVALSEITSESVRPNILRSVSIKEEVVSNDFYEKGERKILNVGHTVGHAIESYFMENGNHIAHGEAVALGMICESHIAKQLALLNETDYDEISKGITKFFSQDDYSLPEFDALSHYLLNDKKNANGKVLFSLPTAIGSATYNIEVSLDQIRVSYSEVFGK